jgi:hypothetical protein
MAAFEFTAVYDLDTIQCAALAMIKSRQRQTMLLTFGSTALVALSGVAAAFYLHVSWLLWVPVPMLAADLLMRHFMRRRVISRLTQALEGKAVHFVMADETLAYSLNGGDHRVPWKNFHHAQLEPRALLLYVGRIAALVIPVAGAPSGAVDFAVSRVSTSAQVA